MKLAGYSVAIPSTRDARWALLFVGLAVMGVLAVAYVGTQTDWRYQWQSRNTIAELRELPLGHVKIRGVVTYVDSANQRFWVQDETGAIAVDKDPGSAGMHFGDVVLVQTTKTHAYDPALGVPSLGLTDFRIDRNAGRLPLPVPATAVIPALSEAAKTGIRVTVEGVVQGAIAKGGGLVRVDLGAGGKQVEAIVPGNPGHFVNWLNARVRITGVLEVLLDEGGSPTSELIWAQKAADIQKISDPPPSTEASTIRSLYADRNHISAHRVLLRGIVLYQETPERLIVEDQWGTIGCDLDQPGRYNPGTPMEVRGFLQQDGLAINLIHTAAAPLLLNGPRQKFANDRPTTIASVRALSEDIIRTAPPVKVAGVVTYVNTVYRQLFLQDSTAGIFIKYAGTPTSLHQGEKITVTGLANGGDFAPAIVAPKFVSLGPAHLPKPVPMTARAKTGVMDSLYGQVEGVVHPRQGKRYVKQQTSFDLDTTLGPVHVGVMQPPSPETMANLQDATARVRGVVGEVFNSRKQFVGLQLAVSDMSGIEVIEPGNADPFAVSAIPIRNLLSYAPHTRFDRRVVVGGTVTMLGDTFFYIQDRTGGVRIEGNANRFRLGDSVEAAGYASAAGYSPVLTDAIVKSQPGSATINPQTVTADMMSHGGFDSQLVSVETTLLSVENSTGAKTLSVTSGGHTFQAVLYPIDTGQPFPPLQEGSLLRLAGICSVEVGHGKTDNLLNKDAVAFKLLIRSPSDIQVLKGGNWWTLRHSLMLVGILVLAVLFSTGRIAVLLRRIEGKDEQLRVAGKKENAVRQLIGAMHEVRAKKQFTSRVSLPEADELALLGTEFNHMIEELHTRDIAMSEAEAKLQHQALTDALTGLPNRRLLSDRISQNVASAKRDGKMVALLYIDLDGFKLVNDSFGHNFGDVLLVRVAERISSRIRESDTLSRLGGDEFALVMGRLNDIEQAQSVAQLLLQNIAKPFEIDGQEITIGASIGICVFPTQAHDESDLLQFADSAMYAAKRTGKNRVVLFTKDLGDSVRERLTIENQLRRAIEDGDIRVHYQPEFEISSRNLVRFEALARWTHPTLGSIPPSKFIPIAEESGLIFPLGAYVMERACEDCVSWQSNAGPRIEVAVNVSNLQFGRDSFIEEVEAALKKTGLEPALLQIELTESVMLVGLDIAVAKIRQLQSIGVTVAIDDFGTGYSALSYIQKLPFNALKIDRTFMKEITAHSETRAMVRSLIQLAQELDMKVIVEGVESEEQFRIVKEIGADAVQGFLLGHPTPNPFEHLSRYANVISTDTEADEVSLVPEELERA